MVKKKFLLTAKHEQARRAWERELRKKSKRWWGTEVFSDETRFSAGYRKRKAFVFEEEDHSEVKFRHPVSQTCGTASAAEELGAWHSLMGS